ncbi:LuxR C-terminal-related transcriptional regulator [Amycolatopsis speibonae]|uniref:LuxR C-terminal-related transcriptional regulator n=1 Tax=Amycolatopsis speibonae TaxID=1450224 RepID=A0ABV7P0R9_9PSEU
MTEPGNEDDAEAILSYLDEARSERARFCAMGRFSEADEAVLRALRHVLSVASPNITGPDLGNLVYVAGRPRPGAPRTLYVPRQPVPAKRLTATCALMLVNRGCEPKTAVDMADGALFSYKWDDMGTFWYAVTTMVYAGEADLARAHLERAVAHSGWLASPVPYSLLTVLRGRAAALRGEPAAARQLFESVLERGAVPQFAEVTVAWAVAALVDLGDIDSASTLLRVHRFDRNLDNVVDRAEVFAARGGLYQALGRSQLAYEDYLACGRELTGLGVTNPAVIAWRSQAALCAAAMGRLTLAFSLAQEELVQARRWGVPQTVGTALRAVAHLAEEGRDVELLREAIGLLRKNQSGAKSVLMRAQYELGVKLSFRGQSEEGRAALRESLDTAISIGSKVWADRVDDAIRRWAVASAVEKLTVREAKVANLAKAGSGNKEIAAHLKLANSTVEFHLSNVYRKLGISGRDELRSIMVPLL